MADDKWIGTSLSFNRTPKNRSKKSIWSGLKEEPTGTYYPITDKRTGKSYEMEWNEDRPPSKHDVYQFIDDQNRDKSLLEMGSEGLTDFPSRMSKKLSGPMWRYGESESGKGFTGKLARGGAAFTEALGDVTDTLTSPISLGLTAVTGGTSLAARQALPTVAKNLNRVTKAAGVAQMGHGGYNTYEGLSEGDTGRALGGVVEAGLGLFGARARVPGVRENARVRPDVDYKTSIRSPRRLEEGRTFTSPDNNFVEGEFTEAPEIEQRMLSPRPPQALPRRGGSSYQPPQQPPNDPMGHKFFQGPRGTSDLLQDVSSEPPPEPPYGGGGGMPTSFGLRSRIAALRNFGRRPQGGGGPQNSSPSEPLPDIPAPPVATSPLADIVTEPARPAQTPKTSAIPKNQRPMSKYSSEDLEFMALDGDVEARAELKSYRPKYWERIKNLFKDETGAIGDLKKLNSPVKGRFRDDPDEFAPGAKPNLRGQVFRGLDWENDLADDAFSVKHGEHYSQVKMQGVEDSVIQRRALEAKLEELPEDGFYPPDSKKGRTLQRLKRHLIDTINSLREDETGAVGRNINEDPKIKARQTRRDFLKTLYEGTKSIDDITDGLSESGWLSPKQIYDFVAKSPLANDGSPKGRALKAKIQTWGLKNGVISDMFETGKLDAPQSGATNYVKQMFDSLKQRAGKLGSDETGAINTHGWLPNLKMPHFLKERDLPDQYHDYVGAKQANRYQYRDNPVAKKLANEIATEKFRGWLAGQGYVDPGFTGKGLGKILDTTPEDLYEAIENLRTKPNKTTKKWADRVSLSKNFAMSAGIPYTGVNAHGFNILARTVIGNPKEALKAGKYLFSPNSAKLDFDAMEPTATWAIRKGLTLTTEGHEIGVTGSTNLVSKPGKLMNLFLEKSGKMFEDPLFQKILPALKLKHFNDLVDDMVSDGLSRELAGRQAAKFTNNLYGGMNWEQFGASKDLTNYARMVILAPDWFQSNLNLGKGVIKGLHDGSTPAGKQYRKLAAQTIGAYAAADVVNYAINGKHMWDNDPGHALDVHIGESDGKQRYIRPFGTGADFMRLPFDMVSSTVKGDLGQGFRIMKNRLSIPAMTGADLLMNQNRFGRPIFGKDVYGRKIPVKTQLGEAATEVSNVFTPPYVRAMKDYATGQAGPEEAVLGGFEMPLRYSHTPRGAQPRRTRSRARR